MEKTYVIKGQPESNWILVDAAGQNVGRLCTQIAGYLMGKHKPTFTPGVAMGDHVVVINAEKLEVSEKDLVSKKYYRHSNYPGGLKVVTLKDQMANHP
ncbi:MAG TPA: 50S ribosomal protein L13, partial [Bellilinea sp.]|nr:50S ribosomal protein L13 [Bellilinea sp.]